MIKYADLFAGIGGIRLGAEKVFEGLGLASNCVLSSEIDAKACETYEANFGEKPKGDICGLSGEVELDFLFAGFPCQPFSYAGKQRGFGDTRGTLFFEVERFLTESRPKAFLLENVRGLLTHDRGRTFATILSRLSSLGYDVKYFLLNSSNFNVPQNRVRLYIVGLLDNKITMSIRSDPGAQDSHKFKSAISQASLFNEKKNAFIGDILETNVDEKYFCSKEFEEKLKKIAGINLSKLHGYRLIDYRGGNSLHSWELGVKGDCTDNEIEFMNILIKNRRRHIFGTHQDGKKLTKDQICTFYAGDFEKVSASLIEKGYLQVNEGKYNPVCGNMSFEIFKFLDPKSISITLTSSDANRLGVIRSNRPTHITPRECARIQGFPDDFLTHPDDQSAYRQFGNSVSVPVISALIYDFITRNHKSLGW